MAASVTHRAVTRKRLWQRFLLTGLGLVFAVSAVLRLGMLDFAHATTPIDPAPATPGSDPGDVSDPGLVRSLQGALLELEARRVALDQREGDLADRERAVAAAQTLVEGRLAELEAAEGRLAAMIATSDQAAETDLDQLTRVYETMPPDTAAALFEQMTPSFAAGFLARMTPPQSAALLSELSPEQAYAISVVLATRNSSAPRLGEGVTVPEDTES